jgi:lambda family phage portal protein
MDDRAFYDQLRAQWALPPAAAPAPAARAPARGARAPIARSNWKGAEYSRLYSDWVAQLLSPDDEIRGDLRSLRARGRESERNNPYAGAFVELVTTNVLGPHGPRRRAQVRDERGNLDTSVNEELDEAWLEWSEGPVTTDGLMSLAEWQHLQLETVAREGEAFDRAYLGADLPHGLAFAGIDPDLVDDTYNVIPGAGAGPEIRMGIEVDERGRRIAYHVLDSPYQPGSRYRGRMRIPADQVDHQFRVKRAGQTRGVTWLARVMHVLHQLDGYQEAELVHSRAGASQMGFIEWNESSLAAGVRTDPLPGAGDQAGGTPGSSSGAESNEPRVVMDAEPLTVRELVPGQSFKEWSPDHPTTAYSSFVKSNLAATATGLLVSYLSLANDPGAANYSSMRSALLLERDLWLKLQAWWIRRSYMPICDRWLQAAFLTGRLRLPGGDWRRYRSALWIPKRWAWVDPLKDAQATKTLLELRLTSHTRVCAELGVDFEEILEERAADEKLAASKGIVLEPPPAAPGAPQNPTDDGEEPGGDGEPVADGNGNGAAARVRNRVRRALAH